MQDTCVISFKEGLSYSDFNNYKVDICTPTHTHTHTRSHTHTHTLTHTHTHTYLEISDDRTFASQREQGEAACARGAEEGRGRTWVWACLSLGRRNRSPPLLSPLQGEYASILSMLTALAHPGMLQSLGKKYATMKYMYKCACL